MPSKSPKQHRFMEAVAHNPDFAKKVGVPQSVGQDFAQADEAKAAPQMQKVSKPLGVPKPPRIKARANRILATFANPHPGDLDELPVEHTSDHH